MKWFGVSEAGEEKAFIVTGDINAMWLRDSAAQLHSYRNLIEEDDQIAKLFRGTINTQAMYIAAFPYCNAFNPLQESGLPSTTSPWAKNDLVYPNYDNKIVYECKYELDSLSYFLQLSFDYFSHSNDINFFKHNNWRSAIKSIMKVLNDESMPTFIPENNYSLNCRSYRFQRYTDRATETFSNDG